VDALTLGCLDLAVSNKTNNPTSAAIKNQPFELSMKLKYDSAGVSALAVGNLTFRDV
jgi:hypothetical protein